MAVTKQLYTVEEIANRLNLHAKTIRRYITNGNLKAKRIGKEYRITRADFEAFAGGDGVADRATIADAPRPGVEHHRHRCDQPRGERPGSDDAAGRHQRPKGRG
jgi:excisionase family DNA binding protein